MRSREILVSLLLVACTSPPGGGGGAVPTPPPSLPIYPSSDTPGPAPLIRLAPLVQPAATPAPGGISTAYPRGTSFITGEVEVRILAGGRFEPAKIFVRPGTSTVFVNADRQPHTVTGFGGATSGSGQLGPGERFTHQWMHPGTWTFHDTLSTPAPAFTVIDVPASPGDPG